MVYKHKSHNNGADSDSWRSNKLNNVRGKDLREEVINKKNDYSKQVMERFKGRLVLKEDWGEKARTVTDRVVKNAKQNQLDPDTNDRWGHGMYDGPVKQKLSHRNENSEDFEERVIQPVKKGTTLNKVLVRNLPSTITKVEVQKIFNRYGEVTKAQVEDGFAIVSFADNEGALQAHYVTNHQKLLKISGNKVKVSMIEDDEKNGK